MAKICANCGKENIDEALFCESCGCDISQASSSENKQASIFEQATAVEYFFSKDSGFVSKKEETVQSLSSDLFKGWLKLIKTERITLSNRRLYYVSKAGLAERREEETIVDVQDITGVKLIHNNPLYMLAVCVLPMIAIAIYLAVDWWGDLAVWLIPLGILWGMVTLCLYFLKRKSYLKIEYSGGEIRCNVNLCAPAKVREFQQAIYTIKDGEK